MKMINLMMIRVMTMSVTRPKLCELDWFKGIYKKIYNVLSVENMLPDPCQITVLYPGDVEVDERVMALAWWNDKTIWFRNQPPDPVTFAHELIHLIDAKTREIEEVYSYNLARLAVVLALEGIVPRTNIVRLFDVSENDILRALQRVYRIKFDSLEEYFKFIGVIPPFIRLEWGENGSIVFVRKQEYNARDVVINTVTELASGAEYDRLMLDVVLELLDRR